MIKEGHFLISQVFLKGLYNWLKYKKKKEHMNLPWILKKIIKILRNLLKIYKKRQKEINRN